MSYIGLKLYLVLSNLTVNRPLFTEKIGLLKQVSPRQDSFFVAKVIIVANIGSLSIFESGNCNFSYQSSKILLR